MSEQELETVTPEATPVEEPTIEPTVEPTIEPVTEPDKEPDVVSITEIEAAAQAQGWDPSKGEKTALEFLADGRIYRDRMFEEVKTLRDENKKIYELVAEQNFKQDTKERNAYVASIDQELADATEAGDVDRVKALADQKAQVAQQPIQQPQQPHPEDVYVNDWMSENKWFGDHPGADPEMTATARGFIQAEVLKDGGRQHPTAQLPVVLARMKKVYPEQWTAPKSPNAGRGAGVETSSTVKTTKAKGLTKADLTEDEARDFDKFVDLGMKPEKLLASVQKLRDARG